MALGRDFRRFWLAAVLANVGDGIRLAALPFARLAIRRQAACGAAAARTRGTVSVA